MVQNCQIITEIAQAHDGSLGTAHAYVDAVAHTGADAVKFQTHIAAAESTPTEPWRVQFSRQDASRFDYWKRMEFTETQWKGLRDHANERGLQFLSSPFSIEAIELLKRVGVSAWKVASGEVNNGPMLDCMAETGLPILLSTGMSTWEEIDSAVAQIKSRGLPLTVLQCTSEYPCPAERVGLNLIAELRRRYDCAVGFSDHSGTIFPGLAAAAFGIDVLEVHATFSRETYGPDVPASVTTSELRQLVEGVRFIETMVDHPVDKDQIAVELQPLRKAFFKSIVARYDLPPGTVISEKHLTFKKPGNGIPISGLASIVNRRTRRAVAADSLLREDDLEN
jgi:N-acetylneuraminate synthase